MPAGSATDKSVDRQRASFLHRIERLLETPMIVLSMVWLVLLVVELTYGRSELGHNAGNVIWAVFIADFLLRLAIAPRKVAFLRRNVLTMVSLVVPALRLFRVFRAVRLLRAARGVRGLNLVRVLTTANRGMRALGASFRRRGFTYVLALTCAVTLLGAAGMFAFERGNGTPAGNLDDFGSALWWTAMIMTTMGSDYWPQSPEGRILCLVLALYAFAIFGYVTAALASYFVGRDAENPHAELAGQNTLRSLQEEIRDLRHELAQLRQTMPPPDQSDGLR